MVINWKNDIGVTFSRYDVIINFFWRCFASRVKFSYWSKFHVNIIIGSRVGTIFFHKGLRRNPEIGNTPIWVCPIDWFRNEDAHATFLRVNPKKTGTGQWIRFLRTRSRVQNFICSLFTSWWKRQNGICWWKKEVSTFSFDSNIFIDNAQLSVVLRKLLSCIKKRVSTIWVSKQFFLLFQGNTVGRKQRCADDEGSAGCQHFDIQGWQ